jgi:hypothetical protein
MKRALIVLIVLLAATGAFAQVDFAAFESGFESFAQDLSNGLPFNSSTGLNWSPAYIGQFPHFGIGLTVGATTIPYAAMSEVFTALGISLPSELNFISKYGIPIPAYTIDARLGGFFLPFDIGLKFGYLPPGVLQGQSFTADYFLIGGDIRYALLKDHGFVPAISVGLGYNYIKGGIGVPGLLSGPIQIADFVDPRDNSKHTLELSNPSLGMQWSASVLELKAQISKKILFFTPYLGAAVSYSFGAEAGGGLTASLLYDGATPSASQLALINQAYGGTVNITDQSITVLKNSDPGFDYRAFGGLSFDIFFVYLDIGAAYDFATSALGASVNLRIAL